MERGGKVPTHEVPKPIQRNQRRGHDATGDEHDRPREVHGVGPDLALPGREERVQRVVGQHVLEGDTVAQQVLHTHALPEPVQLVAHLQQRRPVLRRQHSPQRPQRQCGGAGRQPRPMPREPDEDGEGVVRQEQAEGRGEHGCDPLRQLRLKRTTKEGHDPRHAEEPQERQAPAVRRPTVGQRQVRVPCVEAVASEAARRRQGHLAPICELPLHGWPHPTL
mmetsp:Transcript_72317/g.202982  ORF Transcript_72317/g.202982 Transcript_72317/m.202982 type:complete len:221 (+) Transcript_72317:194-856(+)